MNKEMTMARYNFFRHTADGAVWILIAITFFVTIFADNVASHIVSAAAMILSVILAIYMLRINRPRSDEMSEKNMLRAESTASTVIWTILSLIGLVLISTVVFIIDIGNHTGATLSVETLLKLGCVGIWGILGLRDLLVGIFFNKYEKGDDNEWEDD